MPKILQATELEAVQAEPGKRMGTLPPDSRLKSALFKTEDLSAFDGQIALLRLALTAVWEQYGADSAGIVLLGQSFGGLIALGLAASQPDVPFLGVSTHGTGLRWLPGALQRFQSRLSEAPCVQLPFDENARSLGAANSWVHEARECLKQS